MQWALIAFVATVAAASNCSTSPALIHAHLDIQLTFTASCADVSEEILARAQANQDGTWTDPQNGGLYYVDAVGSTQLDLHRDTGFGEASFHIVGELLREDLSRTSFVSHCRRMAQVVQWMPALSAKSHPCLIYQGVTATSAI